MYCVIPRTASAVVLEPYIPGPSTANPLENRMPFLALDNLSALILEALNGSVISRFKLHPRRSKRARISKSVLRRLRLLLFFPATSFPAHKPSLTLRTFPTEPR
ncbi:hypothetical protein TNCV_589551 [Trichonephila clavipes]|nr:hypothetical protein TNCV_589551 [Trichonephila clavipes]